MDLSRRNIRWNALMFARKEDIDNFASGSLRTAMRKLLETEEPAPLSSTTIITTTNTRMKKFSWQTWSLPPNSMEWTQDVAEIRWRHGDQPDAEPAVYPARKNGIVLHTILAQKPPGW